MISFCVLLTNATKIVKLRLNRTLLNADVKLAIKNYNNPIYCQFHLKSLIPENNYRIAFPLFCVVKTSRKSDREWKQLCQYKSNSECQPKWATNQTLLQTAFIINLSAKCWYLWVLSGGPDSTSTNKSPLMCLILYCVGEIAICVGSIGGIRLVHLLSKGFVLTSQLENCADYGWQFINNF